ncbi:MAG: hypothetical protein HY242_09490 [Afipia sp.]|nr:hypothetical protein [Afipia sp.]
MYPFFRAIFFEVIGLWSAVQIWNNLKTGIIDTGRGWRMERDTNPAGFWLYTLFNVLFVAFAIAVLLNAIGLIADPFPVVNRWLRFDFR